ncbi:hypothetical protein DPMN_010050 [Dreissena polymorpha]|uniref:Uncharacterized protein n=1 Tax=Dreissena polymorpha TaxID=45954 RepID=A0A9D4RYS0_DREPO|nr:hypothetical protein DPMN_010050 [Dreissena polymorpha]
MCQTILKSRNKRHSYGLDKLVPPPTDIHQSKNQFFPSENLGKNTGYKTAKNNCLGMNIAISTIPRFPHLTLQQAGL